MIDILAAAGSAGSATTITGSRGGSQGGRRVGGVDLVLTVTRCGMNYKFSGQDFAAQTTYVGVCPASTVEAAINGANADRRKGEKIRRLNNREDVLFVLLWKLSILHLNLIMVHPSKIH